MNDESKQLYEIALQYAPNNNTTWSYDYDKINDYFALYNDTQTVIFSYRELLLDTVLNITVI